jgi:2-dehydropantoate 2-reductase
MKIVIVGAGAIGAYLGTRLAATGEHSVSALARGATRDALQRHGWRAVVAGELLQASAFVSERAEDLGPQDLVIIAVKGPALPLLAPTLGPLIGPHTQVVPAMNGVPWWFCADVAGFGDAPLSSVDPGGGIASALPFSQVIGCVVHISSSTPEPGVAQHKMGQGLIIGEPRGGASERVERLTRVLRDAGFEVTASTDVRRDIWYKLWGNLTMNPISALTGATVDRILDDPLLRAFCSQAMREASAVGARIGCPIEQTPEDRHAITRKLGAFKTSMLQDVEAGRSIELDAIVTAVHEIARRLELPTPGIDALLGLTRLFARVRGLYPDDAG